MVRAGEIRGVNVRSAGQHGLGIYDIEGWITHSSVDIASAGASGASSAVYVNAAGQSRVEDLQLYASGCDHAVEIVATSARVGGVDVLSEPVNGRYSVPTNTIWSRSFVSPYSLGGTLVVGVGTFRLPFSWSTRIISVRATLGVAATGSSVIVDVHKNGTTIFTTQANRPEIPVSTNISQIAFPDVTAIVPGDYVTIDIDQIGSTLPGENLVVSLQMENDD